MNGRTHDSALACCTADALSAPLRARIEADAAALRAANPTHFLSIVRANPDLRARIGNPDELRSNKLDRTLDALKHRVDRPEAGVAESEVGGRGDPSILR